MPDHKEQHYVPRVYLRQFATDPQRKTIGVWIHSSDKIVTGAPIKSQCADPYFYGADLILEKLLQGPETLYGQLIDETIRASTLSAELVERYIFFWLLQYLRAKVNLFDTRDMTEKFRKIAYQDGNSRLDDSWSTPVTTEQIAKVSISAAREILPTIADLTSVAIVNRTRVPFMTCDQPAVMQNKFLSYGIRRTRSYGLGSAGIYIFMALTPELGFLAYDSDVYHIPSRQGYAVLARAIDIHQLNTASLAQASKCMYFKDLANGSAAIDKLRTALPAISRQENRFTIAVQDQTQVNQSGEVYRVVDQEAFEASGKTLLHAEKLVAAIPNHLSALRTRHMPRYIDTRSQAGLVRILTYSLRRGSTQ